VVSSRGQCRENQDRKSRRKKKQKKKLGGREKKGTGRRNGKRGRQWK